MVPINWSVRAMLVVRAKYLKMQPEQQEKNANAGDYTNDQSTSSKIIDIMSKYNTNVNTITAHTHTLKLKLILIMMVICIVYYYTKTITSNPFCR